MIEATIRIRPVGAPALEEQVWCTESGAWKTALQGKVEVRIDKARVAAAAPRPSFWRPAAGVPTVLLALLLPLTAAAQESAIEANPCAFFPGNSTEECAAFGAQAEQPPWQWGPADEAIREGEPPPEAPGLEAAPPEPLLTLRRGDPVYFAPVGFGACQVQISQKNLAEVFALPGAVHPGGQLNLSAPGVCDALRLSNLVGCGSLHTPWRQTCADHAGTRWVWSCESRPPQWVLGGGRCGLSSTALAFEAAFGRLPLAGDSEERLALVATCGLTLPTCQGGPGCPGPRPTLPPVPDPCTAPPLPPPPPEPDPEPEPEEDILVEVLNFTAGQWRFTLTTEGESSEHTVAPGAVMDVGRGVGFSLPGLPPCPPPQHGRIVASIEQCDERSFSGRWFVPGEPVRIWSGMTRALLRGPLGEVELRNQCPAAEEPPEPPVPPEEPPAPPVNPPDAELLIPGEVCRPTQASPTCELRLETGKMVMERMELSFTVDMPVLAPSGRQQVVACAGDGRFAKGGVPGFLASTGPGAFFFRSGNPGGSAGQLSRRSSVSIAPQESYGVDLIYDSAVGRAEVDVGSGMLFASGRQPVPLQQRMVCWLGFEPGVNPDEHPSLGWAWRDLEWRAWGRR